MYQAQSEWLQHKRMHEREKIMVNTKQKLTTRRLKVKKSEMITPEGELVLVPEKKVQVKLAWGWSLVSEDINSNNAEARR